MRKNKKILIKFICMIVIILLLCIQILPVFAKNDAPVVFGNDTTIDSSGGVIEIKLSSNVEICGGNFNIVYDSSLLGFDYYIQVNNVQFSVNSNYTNNKVRISFASSNAINSGTIIQLYFHSNVDYAFVSDMIIESIRLYDSNGNFYEPEDYNFNCSVTKSVNLEYAYFTQDLLQIGVGEEYAMNFVTIPANSALSRVFWSVSNEKIASISNDGLIKGLKKGETDVFCDIYGANGNYIHLRTTISVYEKPNLTIGTIHSGVNNEVKVRVFLERSSKDLTSGSFNIEYDPSILRIKSASVGKVLSSYFTNININYKQNAIRINFAGQVPITSGECLTLCFETLNEGTSELKPYDISFFTSEGEEYSPNIGIGRVEVDEIVSSSVLIKNKDGSYVAHIGFESSVDVSSGTIMFEYDPTLMEIEQCLASTTQNYNIVINKNYSYGKIRVSFASTEAYKSARIVRISLRPLKQETNTDSIVVSGDFYDDNNNKVFPSSTTSYFSHAKIIDYTIGDINDDNSVNNKDLFDFMRYLSGFSISVNNKALDVNGDGKVNNKDLTRLFKYLSGWDVEIF